MFSCLKLLLNKNLEIHGVLKQFLERRKGLRLQKND